MKFFNKYFFFGLGTGLVLGVILVIGGFAIFGFIMMKSFSDMNKMEDRLKPPLLPIERSVEYDWIIQSLDGQSFDMGNLKGRLVFLNFWATWCIPCKVEMASIQRLYDQLNAEGVLFACISKEKKEIVSNFVEKEGYTLPIYTMNGDLPEIFETRGIPATFILTPEGKVALKHVGSAKWDDPSVIDFIRKIGADLQTES